jgi:probable HAF family extracellular repeat protein
LERLEPRDLLTLYYTVTDLGTLGGTGLGASGGFDVNERGQVAGTSYIACNCATHPFLWAGGTLFDLGTLGTGPTNSGRGINDLGQVVGSSNGHPFVWSRQSGMMDLGFTGYGNDINNAGEIVGSMQIGYRLYGYRWKNGRALNLGALPGGGSSTAVGVNEAGRVVGQASGRRFLHAFAWSETTGMMDLDAGHVSSTSGADAINDRGQIVGFSQSVPSGVSHAVYFSSDGIIDLGTLGGYSEATDLNNEGQVIGWCPAGPFLTDLTSTHMVNLNTLIPSGTGWTLGTPWGINDAGQITGGGTIHGQGHAYLLTPVRETADPVGAAPTQGQQVRAPGAERAPSDELAQVPRMPRVQQEQPANGRDGRCPSGSPRLFGPLRRLRAYAALAQSQSVASEALETRVELCPGAVGIE